MLREVLGYPLRDGGEERLLVGWIIHLVHALLAPGLPLVYVLGYLLQVLRASSRGDPAPSPWEWRRILVDAGRGLVVAVAYGLLPAAVLVFGYFLLPRGQGDFTLMLVAAVTSMTFFLAIPPLFLLPAGLTQTARTGRIRAAFDRDAVVGTGTELRYLLWWSIGAVVFATSVWVADVLGPYLVGYLGAFYLEVVACYAFGRGCRDE